MKNLIIASCFIFISTGLNTYGQNYLISFEGTGATTTVSTVKVENLTAGTSLTLNGSDILHLKSIITGVNLIDNNQSSDLKIYPNPMTDNSILQLYSPVAGNATIAIYDMTGKKVSQIQIFLDNGQQEFRLSGLNNGFYLISIQGATFKYSGKLICNGKSLGPIKLEKISNNQISNEKNLKTNSKGSPTTVDMAYTSGDRLKFTGISGNFSTVLIDIPTGDKSITFNLIECTDGDNNSYPVVEIGTQVWMAENLKTTKYKDGTTIPNVTDLTSWGILSTPAYCLYKNTASNKEIYGALYNWYVVNSTSNGGKNVCPTGWHVPTENQMTIMTTFLGGESAAGAKLKESGTTHWTIPNDGATNETGFTALPGGNRDNAGDFGTDKDYGCWWFSSEYSLTDAWYVGMNYSFSDAFYDFTLKKFGFSVRCLEGEQVLPAITTSDVTSIFQTTATSGGNVTSDGLADISARGICWSTIANPTIANNKTLDGKLAGTFISQMIGLTPGTAYYVRAFVTNSIGTSYGNEVSFSTSNLGSVIDVDLNTYPTITIGTQTWMVENLKTTKYNNGDLIGTTTPATLDISNETTPKYQWSYGGNESNVTSYGRLYTWYAATDSRNVCPTGWHIPTDEEWTNIENYLIAKGYNWDRTTTDNKIAKSMASTSGWATSAIAGNVGNDQESNNSSGFTALPGGSRYITGSYNLAVSYSYWWSSNEYSTTLAWSRNMGSGKPILARFNPDKRSGFSVRCLKDN